MADEFSQNLAALRLLKLHVGLSTKHIAVINHMINMDTYAEKNTQAKYYSVTNNKIIDIWQRI